MSLEVGIHNTVCVFGGLNRLQCSHRLYDCFVDAAHVDKAAFLNILRSVESEFVKKSLGESLAVNFVRSRVSCDGVVDLVVVNPDTVGLSISERMSIGQVVFDLCRSWHRRYQFLRSSPRHFVLSSETLQQAERLSSSVDAVEVRLFINGIVFEFVGSRTFSKIK